MPLEQDVREIGKQLEKLVADGNPDNETASDLLSQLKELPITLDTLQKTRIGMAVNVVRKATTKDDIQTLAKGLIKSWKKLLDNQEKTKVQRQTSQEKPGDTSSNLNKPTSKSELNSSPPSAKAPNNGAKSSPPRNNVHDPTRRRCQEMIANSLECEQRPEYDPATTSIGIEVEGCIYDIFEETGPKYKNRVKSRVMNLRDKRNIQLRISIIDGEIAAEKFAKMTAEDLAHDDLKQQRKDITAQAIKDHQLSKNTGTTTGQFKCGKCHKMDTSYSQLQTRSADEPMTTFVYCNNCGNRWKFC